MSDLPSLLPDLFLAMHALSIHGTTDILQVHYLRAVHLSLKYIIEFLVKFCSHVEQILFEVGRVQIFWLCGI